MHKLVTTIFFGCILLVSACNTSPKIEQKQAIPILMSDPHSAAQPNNAVVKHLNWIAEVSFDKKQIKAIAQWEIKTSANADTIYFDTKGLDIEKVTLGKTETNTTFTLLPANAILGSALAIKIAPNTAQVNIYYSTGQNAAALQWLEPEQTAGKKSPFLFTQSQAILARTWIPVQDSPGIRFTYTASVKVPNNYLALMSATNPTEKNTTGQYSFAQEKAIPAYLMALAVGDIVFQTLGDKTGVYAEPVMLEKSAYELADMQKMLQAAEQLYGAYAWGRYDVLMLPPSFPFGGMENPMLTFATPTIITGDRSLVSLIAHELAHSWSGNLVTNANWNDFWLNEGFTVYFERRIMEAIEGKSYADMLAYLGYEDLKATVKDFTDNNLIADTHLKLDLAGRDPDDGVSDIAYEKGYCLLTSIEQKVGRKKFDTFLKNYFAQNAFKSITTEEFLAYLSENLIPKDSHAYQEINPEEWIFKPGIPSNFVPVKAARFEAVEKSANDFLAGEAAEKLNTKNWSSHEWQYFLRILSPKLNLQNMAALDKAFHFTQSGNSEIAVLWLEAAVNSNYKTAYPALEQFLMEVGRRKFIKPLYEATQRNVNTKEMGRITYKKARANYHSVSTATLDKIMAWPY